MKPARAIDIGALVYLSSQVAKTFDADGLLAGIIHAGFVLLIRAAIIWKVNQ